MRADLIERLRNLNPWKEMDWPEVCREAADALASLQSGPAGEVVAWQWRWRQKNEPGQPLKWSPWENGKGTVLSSLYETEVRALVVATPAKAGGGWKFVPIEPTEAMLEASNREWDGRMSARSAGVWQAMLAASPSPDAERQTEGSE